MRRFILISALLLASAAAQAGQPRGLILASNDGPKSERIEAVKPDEVKPDASAPVAPTPAAATPAASTPADSTPVALAPAASKPAAPKSVASRPAKKIHATSYASDEAKARRIAARYGISW
jgi:hypothetical protein